MLNEIQSNKNTNESNASSNRLVTFDLSFILFRSPLSLLHYFFFLLLLSSFFLLLLFVQAVDTMDLDVLFPGSHSGLPDAVIDSRVLKELERSTLNEEQKKALRSMVDPRYTGVRIMIKLLF